MNEKYARIAIIILIASYIIVAFPSFYPFPQLTTKSLDIILNNMDIGAVSEGTFLIVGFPEYSQIIQLSAECSAIALFVMFLLGIFIVPKFSLKHRLMAIPFIIVIFLGNLLRILIGILLSIQWNHPEFIIFFHDTFGQVIIFFWVIGSYIAWLKLTGNFPRIR